MRPSFQLFCLLAIALCSSCTTHSIDDDVAEVTRAICTSGSLNVTPIGPADPGTQVTLVAASVACGAGETAEFRFGYHREGVPGLTLIQDWSTSDTAHWDTTGLPSGKYVLYAYARAVGTTATSYRTAPYMLKDVCTSTTLAASPTSPQAAGTLVTLSAQATCTGGTAEYRFLYRRIDQVPWLELQGWTTTGSAAWDTSGFTEAKYNLVVQVRRQGNASGWEGIQYLLFELGGFPTLTSGLHFSCARLPDGSVRCWGNNAYGQHGATTPDVGLAPGEMGDALPSVDLGGGNTAMALTAGPHHACAILNNGSVKCWGENRNGALGLGDLNHRSAGAGELGDALPAVALGTGRTARSISAGYSFTCALLDNDQVKCWGANAHGQLGQGHTADIGDAPGEMGDTLLPIDLGSGRTAKAITTGHSHVCALLDNDQVKCWGYNTAFGVLGLGDTVGRGDHPGEMGDALPAVDLGAGRTAVSLTAGAQHTCAVLDNQSVKCWGQAGRGQLGLGDTNHRGDASGEMGDALPPVDLGPGQVANEVFAGTSHTCAVLTTGNIKCWGDNRSGQLGLGDTAERGSVPGTMGGALPTVSLGTGRTASSLSVGLASTCALLDDQTIKCWGGNGTGALGIGDNVNRGDKPGQMGDSLPIVSVGTSLSVLALPTGNPNLFNCARLSDASIKCWGSNYLGELGVGASTAVADEPNEAASTVNLGAGRTAVAIGAANYALCVLLDSAQVKCMGAGSALLGQGDRRSRGARPTDQGDNLAPIPLGVGRSVRQLAVGAAHACAILDNSQLKCWGDNAYGQLGLGDAQARGDDPGELGDGLAVVQLGSGRFARSIFAGGNATCAILDNADLKCWGQNSWGRLGLGDTAHRGDNPGEMGDALPVVDLGTGRRATTLAMGGNSTCATLDNLVLKCWGGGGQGLLGTGATQPLGDGPGEMGDALPGVSLGSGLVPRSVAVGLHHVCVALDNSRVKCWGDGEWGQTGLGSSTDLGDQPNEMGDALPFVSLGAARYSQSVSAGQSHSCSVFRDSTIKCWGDNAIGQLGIGGNLARGRAPGQMGEFLPEVQF